MRKKRADSLAGLVNIAVRLRLTPSVGNDRYQTIVDILP
jgi:hypothetical protein